MFKAIQVAIELDIYMMLICNWTGSLQSYVKCQNFKKSERRPTTTTSVGGDKGC